MTALVKDDGSSGWPTTRLFVMSSIYREAVQTFRRAAMNCTFQTDLVFDARP
jgi:hypothetical protein